MKTGCRRACALKRPLTVFAALVAVTIAFTVCFGLLVGPTALNDMLFGSQSTSPRRSISRSTANVTILMWYGFFGDQPYALNECPLERQCAVTYDRALIGEADAIVFHIVDVHVATLPSSPAFPGQKFVAFAMESPLNSFWDVVFLPKNYFHWSMTYLGASSVPSPYGAPWISKEAAQQRGIPPWDLSYDKEDVLRRKTVKGAVWMAGRCKAASGREKAVAALSESNFRVDIGGKCAGNTSMQNLCPRNNNCDDLFGRYYFYIAAENSICIDYITEKYWKRFYYPSVPIVMRRYIYEGHLPPKSFIAMDDYESPTAMAEHLNYLMDNPEEYLSYFAWRQQGLTRVNKPRDWIGMCNLCARLLRGDDDQDDKRIPDFRLWYESQSKCEDDSFAVAWSKRIRQ